MYVSTPMVEFWNLSSPKDAEAYSKSLSPWNIFIWEQFSMDSNSSWAFGTTELCQNFIEVQKTVLNQLYTLITSCEVGSTEWMDQRSRFFCQVSLWLSEKRTIVPQQTQADFTRERRVAAEQSRGLIQRYYERTAGEKEE